MLGNIKQKKISSINSIFKAFAKQLSMLIKLLVLIFIHICVKNISRLISHLEFCAFSNACEMFGCKENK